MATVQQKCCVFIDNSNLFIEGQKFYARHKKLRTSVSQDIRFRIETGRMLSALLQGREKIVANLYGSEPPPIDSVWQDIRSKGILVKTFERNAQNNEKEVDSSISVDATVQACELKEPTGSVTFIIISGDRDYLPVCEVIVQRNWKLEIVAWKTCLAQKIRNFVHDNQSKGVSLILLDDLAVSNPDIFFLQDRWNERKREWLPPDRTIVFEHEKPVENKEAKQLNSDVTDFIQLPCWYRHRPDKDAQIVMIILIVLPDQEEGKDELCKRIKAKFATRCKKINSMWQNDAEEEEEDESKLCEKNEAMEEDDSGKGGFKLVELKRKKRKQESSDQCEYCFSCRDGKNCRYAHTDAEKEYFKNCAWNLGKRYKAKYCTNAANNSCQRNPKQCTYAHALSEARCYNCKKGGLEGVHWMDQCPNKES